MLVTSSSMPEDAAERRYFYYAEDGSERDLTADYRNGNGMIWQEHGGSRGGKMRLFEFFVGTKEQSKVRRPARADAAFFSAIHVGHLCSGDYARQACCASGRGVSDVSSRVDRRTRFRFGGERDLTRSTGGKRQGRTQMGRKSVSFCTPLCFLEIRIKHLF